ncbi:ABC transporter permease [Rubritalea spongiae]|uniref:ABC transporter permease n=1 Tax=Rubritalea spongiae TaxID=430797 RepID=A0ABW5DZZ2_9BACT
MNFSLFNYTGALQVFKREFSSFFTQITAYALIIVFLLLSLGFCFSFGHFMEIGDASLEYSFFRWLPWFLMFLVPAVGMRLWSDEYRNGTIELIGTLPIPMRSVILGKYMASLAVWAITLALTFPIWIVVNYLGDPDNLLIVSGYLGSLLVCACFLAVTSLVSAFTRDQVVCLVVSVFICAFMTLAGFEPLLRSMNSVLPEWLSDLVASTTVDEHFRSMVRGNVRLHDLVWFFSIIVGGLLGTNAVLKAKRA